MPKSLSLPEPLSRSGCSPSQFYAEDVCLQAIEWTYLSVLHTGSRKASVQIWSLAEVMAKRASGHAHMAPNLTSDSTMPPVLMASNVRATVLQELKKSGYAPESGRGGEAGRHSLLIVKFSPPKPP